MRTSGISIHCDVVPRAGQRKATRGNSGLSVLFCSSTVTMLTMVGVLVNAESTLFFFHVLEDAAVVDILCVK
jgi:hypothetical protein